VKQKLAEAKKALAAVAATAAVLVAAGALSGVALTIATVIIAVAGSLGVGAAVYKTSNTKGQ